MKTDGNQCSLVNEPEPMRPHVVLIPASSEALSSDSAASDISIASTSLSNGSFRLPQAEARCMVSDAATEHIPAEGPSIRRDYEDVGRQFHTRKNLARQASLLANRKSPCHLTKSVTTEDFADSNDGPRGCPRLFSSNLVRLTMIQVCDFAVLKMLRGCRSPPIFGQHKADCSLFHCFRKDPYSKVFR